MSEFDNLVQSKVDGDADFQATLADLSDDEKTAKVSEKIAEVREAEWKALSEGKKNAETIAEDQRKRAEKAEKAPPKEKKEADAEPDLSSTDLYALMQAQVPQEDIEEVKKSAKLLGKTIAETLKESVVIKILAERKEERATADATNTRNQRPANKKMTDAEILAKADKGELPEPGTPEAEQLFHARRARRN